MNQTHSFDDMDTLLNTIQQTASVLGDLVKRLAEIRLQSQSVSDDTEPHVFAYNQWLANNPDDDEDDEPDDDWDEEYHPSECDECPECGSDLVSKSESEGDGVFIHVDTCPVCGWSDEYGEGGDIVRYGVNPLFDDAYRALCGDSDLESQYEDRYLDGEE